MPNFPMDSIAYKGVPNPDSSALSTKMVRGTVNSRLGLDHFAFYRAYLEREANVDLCELSERYLSRGSDPRRVQLTIKWLQDEFTVAARRCGDTQAARLLRIPKEFIPAGNALDNSAPVPSLDEFQRLVDPEFFYGEAELLSLYAEQFGVASAPAKRKGARNLRLRRMRLDALSRLESVAVEPPKGHHDVGDWFSPSIAGRMRAVGLQTLDHLATKVNATGYHWWDTVPRIGVKSATRIVHWLKENESSIGRKLSVRCEAPLRSLDTQQLRAVEGGGTAILPLERFVLPPALDGSSANNRAPAHVNRTGARNDLEAVRIWLGRKSGHTFRSYRSHIERLLLWSVLQRGKSMSDVVAEDLQEYFRFLAQPEPTAMWIGPSGKRAERWSPAWRPFSGGAAGSSLQTAKAVLNAYFRWAVSLGYLKQNPNMTADSTVAGMAGVVAAAERRVSQI